MNISKHAEERYAERIMDRDTKGDAAVFVNQHKQKIQEDIEKMIEYGTLLYSGKSMKENTNVKIYIKDMWVIIVDSNKNLVVTLYDVDLGLGDELNKAFVEKAVSNIERAREKVEAEKVKADEDKINYMKMIKENESTIADYRKLIRSIESQNAAYSDIIKSITANVDRAEMDYREAVIILTAKQKF